MSVVAGPSARSYSGDTRFNVFAGVRGEFYPWEKFGCGAGLHFLKEKDAAWMSMAAVFARMAF
jgi:hypothetical protein